MLVRLLAIFLFGQQASAPTIRLDVKQVLVPVIVTDKKGHPVADLGASDFHITEDGVQQDIVAFTKESAAAFARAARVPDGAKGQAAGSAAAAQHIWVICFDTLHTSNSSFTRAKAAVEKVLDKGRENGDQFVLVSLGRQLQIVQPATRDVAALRARLGSKEFAATMGGSETGQLANGMNDVKRRLDGFCSSCPCGRDANDRKSTCDVERQQIRQDLDARAEQFAMYSSAFFAGLKGLVEELAKLEGHRTVVLVSDGFTLTPGKELYAIASSYLPNSPYFKLDPARNMQPVLDESLKVAAARNIVLSTIDTRGVYSPAFLAGGSNDASNAGPGGTGRQEMIAHSGTTNAMRGGSLVEEMDSKMSSVAQNNGSVLAQLAKATGGIYFHDSNDLPKGFREVLEDGSVSYVLAYVPKNSAADGNYRRISVEVSAKNAAVRAKAGYWAENAAAH